MMNRAAAYQDTYQIGFDPHEGYPRNSRIETASFEEMHRQKIQSQIADMSEIARIELQPILFLLEQCNDIAVNYKHEMFLPALRALIIQTHKLVESKIDLSSKIDALTKEMINQVMQAYLKASKVNSSTAFY